MRSNCVVGAYTHLCQVLRLLEDDLAERKEHSRQPFIPSSKHVLNPLSLWVRATSIVHVGGSA